MKLFRKLHRKIQKFFLLKELKLREQELEHLRTFGKPFGWENENWPEVLQVKMQIQKIIYKLQAILAQDVYDN